MDFRVTKQELEECRALGQHPAMAADYLGVTRSQIWKAMDCHGVRLVTRGADYRWKERIGFRESIKGLTSEEAVEHLLGLLDMVHPPFKDVLDWQFDEVRLTETEKRVLYALAAKPGVLRCKESLMAELYLSLPEDQWPEMKIVDVFICKVRKKIRGLPFHIITERGVGWRLVKDDPAYVFPWDRIQQQED